MTSHATSQNTTHLPTGNLESLRNRIPKLEPRRRKPQQSNPLPVPETPTLPPPPHLSTISFTVPRRRILSQEDHELFLASPTYSLILAWVFGLSESVRDKPISAVKDADLSQPVRALLAILDEVETLCRESPPHDQGGSRFGNKTFRIFLDKVKGRAPEWHARLGVEDAGAVAELSVYLDHSFGNRARIDYGSGHELNFVVWLLCLYQLSLLHKPDFPALVLRVFARYLEVMRLVQSSYYLEPAGSHGVWGLDDYQFLPFLFGASQLLHHPFITPLSIHQQLTLEEGAAEYLYLGQVLFVNGTKTVSGLRWHSPMLDDISSAKGWVKVEAGMRRMFVAEVLRKLPVMQHFLFGSLIPAAPGMSESPPRNARQDGAKDTQQGSEGAKADNANYNVCDDDEEDLDGEVDVFDKDGVRHVHQPGGWGDCCGIKVPSSIGAAQEMQKRGSSQLRRIPFD
ncbi:hypothetical protein VTK73DRAFT_6229 [Phialemonium thermophilum]|uniref:Serine/threonine-protein phosphatase 2A activator n=1 Tax=Phialemonium thermophilum TaxID=223376 RepID=A0ABR3XX64_9PEZI